MNARDTVPAEIAREALLAVLDEVADVIAKGPKRGMTAEAIVDALQERGLLNLDDFALLLPLVAQDVRRLHHNEGLYDALSVEVHRRIVARGVSRH